MKNSRLKYLLDGYIAGTLSVKEQQEFFNLLSSAETDEEVREYLLKTYGNLDGQYFLDNAQSKRILSSILNVKIEAIKQRPVYFRLGRHWMAAAIILCVAGISFFYIFTKNNKNNSFAIHPYPTKFKNDVSPGSIGAILKLSDGSLVALDSSINKRPIQQGNATITKHGGTLSYNANGEKNQKETGYNTVETPRGRQFHIKLEDGTEVWLNAASSINFPVIFRAGERDVTITGEVYFEVAKNKQKPFHVSVNGTVIEVLGTHFNINSYTDEGSIKTTLLEGSVKVNNGKKHVMLKPGQQAKCSDAGLIVESNINTSNVVAWKNNLFSFDNSTIKNLMKQLSRWYDVEVVFKSETKNEVNFSGDISRSVNLSNVLRMLESTGEVTFSVEDKKVAVMMK